jgi:hypothetical protein
MIAIMKAEMETKQETTARLEAKIEDKMNCHHEKFEVLRGTFFSGMYIYQPRTESAQEEIKSTMDIYQEKVEVAIHSIRPELEETIRLRVEDQCDM